MNKEQNYHIDTTEEEAALFVDPPAEKKPLFKMPALPKVSVSFPKIFCVVLGAHVLLAIALFGTTVKVSAKEEDKKALAEPIPTPVPEASPSPTPNVVVQEPVPKVVQKPAPKPEAKPEAKPVQKTTPKPASETHPKTPTKSKYTETYVVKQGDTFHKIVKKFKLNGEKLQKINNIKDTNKIVVGQTLKFM